MGVPFIIKLCANNFPAMVAFGIISAIGAIHILFLEETFGKPLK